jgi:hypothetical protein
MPRCANRFRFGPSYLASKLLKFFKLLCQCLNTETLSKRLTVTIAVTHHALTKPKLPKPDRKSVPRNHILVRKGPRRCRNSDRACRYRGVKKIGSA